VSLALQSKGKMNFRLTLRVIR